MNFVVYFAGMTWGFQKPLMMFTDMRNQICMYSEQTGSALVGDFTVYGRLDI